jgi:hypothetical protein
MLFTAERHATNTYPVEVSGWDYSHSFFVEKCELEWSEDSGKCLSLSRALSAGGMIFLRLLLPTSPDRSLPVAYHAYPIGRLPDGRHLFRLDQIQPQFISQNRRK